jgi:hypothetical protein
MGVQVDVWVWGQFSMAPDTELDWSFSITGDDGISLINPDHWYWMSAVPDYEPDQNPNSPSYGAGLAFTEQGAYRPYQNPPGGDNTVWNATLKTSSEPDDGFTWFTPRMLVAPAS